MGARGRAFVTRHFTRRDAARRLEALLRAVTGERDDFQPRSRSAGISTSLATRLDSFLAPVRFRWCVSAKSCGSCHRLWSL